MSVGFDLELGDLASGLIASFPRSLGLAAVPGVVDVMLLSGQPGWAAHANDMIASGVRRLLVIEPCLDSPADIRALAQHCDASGANVILSEGYADNPAISDFRRWQGFGQDLLTLHGLGPVDPSALLLMQIRLLTALGFVEISAHDRIATPDALLVTGQATLAGKPRRLRLMVTRTSATVAMALRMHDATSTARLDLFQARSARPAVATLATDEGLTMLPTIYESGHRARLRQLCNGEVGTSRAALEQFACDVELAEAAIG